MASQKSTPDSELGISIQGVTKNYGSFTAVDGLDIEIARVNSLPCRGFRVPANQLSR